MTAMGTPVLLPVNVGLPRNVPWQGALMGRLRKAMRSADTARPRPDGVAVSPAIGLLPPIVVPVSKEGPCPISRPGRQLSTRT
jgi:hypothetical protein